MTDDDASGTARGRRSLRGARHELPTFLATLLAEEADDRPVPALGLGDQQAAVELLAATRAVLLAHAETEVVTAVARFCLAMGGRLVPASRAGASALPLDLAFGSGPAVLADADAMSIARMRLEQFLPTLVEDARTALARLRHLDEVVASSASDPGTGLLSRAELMRRLATAAAGDVVGHLGVPCAEEDGRSAQGDRELAELGRLLRAELPGADEAGRYGRGEIVVVLRGVPEQDAVRGLHRVQEVWGRSGHGSLPLSAGAAAVDDRGWADALDRAVAGPLSASSRATVPDLAEAHDELWAAMSVGDARSARALVRRHLDEGVAGSALIVDLLAPAQRAVGELWQRRGWTVADEHAATAVVDAGLAAVEAATAAPRPGGASLVLVCAETEWHTLPARMAAQLLREGGATVRFLGPSLPADHLREYLVRLQPDALVLSATMPTSLPGAARSIEAAHDAGTPVIAGGAAFGSDGALAARLGADSWLADPRAFDLGSMPAWDGAAPSRLAWDAYSALEQAAPAAASAAFHGLLVRVPALQQMSESDAARTSEDLAHVLDFLAVAVLVGEDGIMRQFTQWLRVVLESRGVPWSAVIAAYLALADELEPDLGRLLTMLASD